MSDPTEQAAAWFLRLRGDARLAEQAEFRSWLAADPANAEEYRAFEALWNDFGSTRQTEALAMAMERQQRGQPRYLGRGAVALVLMLASAAGWLGYRQSPQQLALHTPIGERRQITLRDGSELQLNAATRIDVRYGWRQRSIDLRQGEALFDVARNPLRPFVIDSGLAQITVRGTRFVVNRLPDRLRISVDHGRVEVASNRHPNETWQVEAGQVVEVDGNGHLRKVDLPADNALAFTRGNLVFEDADLGEIAASLSRYRERPLQAHTGYPSPRISAVLQLSDVEDFIRALPTIAPVRVTEGRQSTELSAR
ncbi:transmembrane sensor [Pseudomonas sp. BIGb0408]|uniref:Transmembrane sensor n=1 Tax=Phytopseudomonas flavescens TaxID=29435 RepID=A0A7Z0BQX5_9GAMM|nr:MULTISPECIES: FecR domain-containing protein [Pseudomonas]MCW2294504.1 transmembrane sensor [Pseudomonas sp. BIGb0408]NYH76222.1 transmembrane sensor [Pseudomonas flavescens]